MNPKQPTPININNAIPVLCKKCSSPYFLPVMKVRNLSAVASPDGQEHMVTIPTLVCLHCHLEIGADGKES